ncbi:MAG: hypothetical protein JSU68_00740 [Phycisphaerales bacterium]|nr:MAG: hypothetical protein JSU68_00740 [Phycisphaerales bacterium]
MDKASSSVSLSDLPRDELLRYGRSLALSLRDDIPEGELLRRIRARQEMLLEIDREALLDVVVWSRIPVRASAAKEELVNAIADLYAHRYSGLSRRGLEALARLRDLELRPGETDQELDMRIRRTESVWDRMRRRRRKVIGDLLGRALARQPRERHREYHFLPETDATAQLAPDGGKRGLVGGIAQRLKGEIQGAADEYIDAKLSEVERRIDAKLDEIDVRLAEWRDREVRNRLKILKITLLATVVVALLSLGYNYLRARLAGGDVEPPPAGRLQSTDQANLGPQRPLAYTDE